MIGKSFKSKTLHNFNSKSDLIFFIKKFIIYIFYLQLKFHKNQIDHLFFNQFEYKIVDSSKILTKYFKKKNQDNDFEIFQYR